MSTYTGLNPTHKIYFSFGKDSNITIRSDLETIEDIESDMLGQVGLFYIEHDDVEIAINLDNIHYYKIEKLIS